MRCIFQFEGQPNALADAAFIVQAYNAHAGLLGMLGQSVGSRVPAAM